MGEGEGNTNWSCKIEREKNTPPCGKGKELESAGERREKKETRDGSLVRG